MEAQSILNKIEMLPENIQQQIVDYIDFLTNRYLNIVKKELQKDENFELTREIKELLDQRVDHHQKNKYKAKTSTEVLNEIAQKYNYESMPFS